LAGTALVVIVAAGCVGDLGTLPGGDAATAADINDHGVTVGSSNTTPGGYMWHAFRQQPGGPMVDLNGTFDHSSATAVNGSGVAVGSAWEGGVELAVLWDAEGVAHDLGAGPDSQATDINDDGTVVGWRKQADGVLMGFVRDALTGEVAPLPLAVPDSATLYQRAAAINDNGDIVGHEFGGSGHVPVMWAAPDHTPVVLPYDPQYFETNPVDINDDGTIVGNQWAFHESWAVFWSGPTHERVVITAAGGNASATGVNAEGEIVGLAQRADRTTWAFFRDPDTGELIDLGGLGGANAAALSINEVGVAAGRANTREISSTGSAVQHAAVFGAPAEEP
jgi:probable HAF family extracellular repeat protein